MPTETLAFIQNIGWMEMTIILVIGLLIFGRRLPEVGRSIGKSIVEFKRGLRDVTDDIDRESRRPDDEKRYDDRPALADADDRRVSRSDAREPAPRSEPAAPSAAQPGA